jgi:hypothetical protein
MMFPLSNYLTNNNSLTLLVVFHMFFPIKNNSPGMDKQETYATLSIKHKAKTKKPKYSPQTIKKYDICGPTKHMKGKQKK